MTTPWRHRYAQRTQRMTSSAVRELLKITYQPDVISFARGLPAPELFPIEEFRTAAEKVLTSAGPKALQYSLTEGYPPLREMIVRHMARYGIVVTLEGVMITGQNNLVDSYAVLGGVPQDFKFDPQTVSYLRVGDNNVFLEGVTISRATGEGEATMVGNRTYWMTASHAGLGAVIEDDAILVNGAALAGHTFLGRGAILSANVSVHQFCWVGERAMGQGNSATSMHIPPFTLFAGANKVVSLNVVGMRRSEEVTGEDRHQVKEAFNLTYRSSLTVSDALRAMDERTEWGPSSNPAMPDALSSAEVTGPPSPSPTRVVAAPEVWPPMNDMTGIKSFPTSCVASFGTT